MLYILYIIRTEVWWLEYSSGVNASFFLQTYLLTRNLLCFKHIFDCFKYARLLLPKLEKKSFILYQITRVMLQLILFIEKKFSLEKERSFKFRKTEECLRAVLGTD